MLAAALALGSYAVAGRAGSVFAQEAGRRLTPSQGMARDITLPRG